MDPTAFLENPRRWVLWFITIIVMLAGVASFAESYRALYDWAVGHGFAHVPIWSQAWPLMIDTFIAAGEAALFIGLTDRWNAKARVFPWSVALLGLAASVTANVGHVTNPDWTWHATAAVPPIAAAASLAVGMGVLKRVVRLHHSTAEGSNAQLPPSAPPRPVETLTARTVPSMTTYSPATAELISELPSTEGMAELPGDEPETERALPRETQRSISSGGGAHSATRSRSWSRDRRARAIVKNNPEISGAELGRKLGVTPRHGQRLLQSMDSI